MAARKRTTTAEAAQPGLFAGPQPEAAPLAPKPVEPLPVAKTGKLKTGFGSDKRRGMASEAGKKGRASLTRKIDARRAENERAGVKTPLWSGGFKKRDARTEAIAKYAIQERWRKYYEQRAAELEKERAKYDPAEIDAVLSKVQEARQFRAIEGKEIAFKKYDEQAKYVASMEGKLKAIRQDLQKIGAKSVQDLPAVAVKAPAPSAKPAPAPAPAAPAAVPAAPSPAAPPAAAPPAAKKLTATERRLALARMRDVNSERVARSLPIFETVEQFLAAEASGTSFSEAETSSGHWLAYRALRKGSLGLFAMAFSYVNSRYDAPVSVDGVAAIAVEVLHTGLDLAMPGAVPRSLALVVEGVSGGALASYLCRVGQRWGKTGKLSLLS